jgi:hypothetical protein
MESDRSIQSNVAPVWWDRERRKISFGGRPFVPALMFFDATAVSVVSAERVIFEANTSDIAPNWKGKYCCDLITSQGTHRIYFAPPNRLARRLNKTTIEKIGGVVDKGSTVGDKLSHLLRHGGVVGDYAAILGFVGKTLALYQTMSDLRVAKVSTARFREALMLAAADHLDWGEDFIAPPTS